MPKKKEELEVTEEVVVDSVSEVSASDDLPEDPSMKQMNLFPRLTGQNVPR